VDVAVVGVVAFLAGNTELALYVVVGVALFIAPELPYVRAYLEALTRRRWWLCVPTGRASCSGPGRPRPAADAEFAPWSETSAVLLWHAGRGGATTTGEARCVVVRPPRRAVPRRRAVRLCVAIRRGSGGP
jgi:hypothetical protein